MVKIKVKQKRRRLPSPTQEDIDRINETLEGRAKFQIQDRDSYDLAFNDYMGVDEKIIQKDERKFRDNAFESYADGHPEISRERLFEEAGGKGVRGLRQDRLKTAKEIVKTEKQYIKKGAKNVDLKGYDTMRQFQAFKKHKIKVTKEILERRAFTVPARIKRTVVYAIKTSVVVRGRRQVRFRDTKGRFASGRLK
tara:strand:+ start:166 stop:750 length:585 start_codon:yes stop_codon:yes gene_type:complete